MRGEVLLTALRRSEMRLAIAIGTVFLTVLGIIPMLYWGIDGLRGLTLAHVPVIWLTLGIGVFPLIVGLGWLYIRVAESYERQFIDLVEDV